MGHVDAGSPRGPLQPSNPRGIAFIIAVKDETQYRVCLQYLDALQIPSGYTVEKIAVFGGASMAECYQKAMDASVARYKIYLHVDTYLVHQGLLPELLHLFGTYPRLGLVGVVGATQLPSSGIWWINNPFHSYGRLWQNSQPGFPASVLTRVNRRRLHLMRFRSFVGDYLPAAAVDAFFVATQYDIPWTRPEFGFEGPWDHVQTLESIKAGLEVGIARQEAVWCVHWGPLEDPSGEQREARQIRLYPQAAALRRLSPEFVGVPARKHYEKHRGGRTMPGILNSADSARDRLGVVIVTFNGREVLLRALRELLSQCAALKEVEYEVVVVGNASADGTIEAVRQKFPQVTVIANASNEWPSESGFNMGLRHLGVPTYVLVMHDDAEFSPETLAEMVRYLKEHLSTAGVVASLINPDGTNQSQRLAIVELVPRRPPRPQQITFVETTCALVRGEVFFDVGLYDERFSPSLEDFDWSLRAKRKGYKFTYLPEARVIHLPSGRLRRNEPADFAKRLPANLWLAYKHAGL